MEDIPGAAQGLEGKVMERAEAALQRFDPFSRIHQHVCGFHFYAHDMTRQVAALPHGLNFQPSPMPFSPVLVPDSQKLAPHTIFGCPADL